MIRTQNNVPRYYIEKSRDFQLLCRLLDLISDSTVTNVNAVKQAITPEKSMSSILPLWCDKVGFEAEEYFDDNALRSIASAFPYIIRKKGTIEGITLACNAILKAEMNPDAVKPVIPKYDKETFSIDIVIPVAVSHVNRKALERILSYIVPAGITYTIQFGVQTESHIYDNVAGETDEYTDLSPLVTMSSSLSSKHDGVTASTVLEKDNANQRMYHTFNHSQVVSAKEATTEGDSTT